MKKAMLFFGLFLAVLLSVQAQTPSHELAKLFHGKQVERVVSEVYEVVPDSVKQVVKTNLDTKKTEVLNTIATIFSTEFSDNEIEQLILFFSSPLAQKWNSLRGDLTSKNFEAIMEWGMKLREKQ